jgi:hypothetical protein
VFDAVEQHYKPKAPVVEQPEAVDKAADSTSTK